MIKITTCCLSITLWFMVAGIPVRAQEMFMEALASGETSVEMRFSMETSDLSDAAGLDAAAGFNLRTRLGYRTGMFKGMQAFVQLHNVSEIVDHYRWPGGGDISRDVIADPHGSRIHQAYVDADMGHSATLRLGRQELILDDARLIGNVGWRQNGQSFDGARLLSETARNRFQLAVITRVNTILLTHVDLDGLILVNNRFKLSDRFHATGFAYLLDTESETPDSRDSATYGLRLDGKAGRFSVDAAYAVQTDYADGENHGGDMINLSGNWELDGWTIGAGMNRISGQDGADRPFDTLFSTAHKFNGWSDQFLATNGGNLANGLQDIYVQAGTGLGRMNVLAVYHLYQTTDGGTYDGDYGSEWNLLLSRSFGKHLSGLIKAAVYRAEDAPDNPTVDETVLWVRLNITF